MAGLTEPVDPYIDLMTLAARSTFADTGRGIGVESEHAGTAPTQNPRIDRVR